MFFGNLFNNSGMGGANKGKMSKSVRLRSLQIEILESRELLSVNPLTAPVSANETNTMFLSSAELQEGNIAETVFYDVLSADVGATENLAASNVHAELILPEGLGANKAGTLQIRYTNTGDTAVSSPLLILRARQGETEGALMTLNARYLQSGFQTDHAENLPAGFSNSVQIIANGTIAGILLPGETIEIPVFWAGWQESLDQGLPVEFSLESVASDNASGIDFTELKTTLKPSDYSAEAWDVVWARLQPLFGTTWGDYVRALNGIASATQQAGISAINRVSDLLAATVQWANDKFNPFGMIAADMDAAVSGPTGVLYFQRSFSSNIADRFVEGDLGFGWDHNWNWKIETDQYGNATLLGPHGARRLFQVDAYESGGFLSQSGDNGTLTRSTNGTYTLTEADGSVFVFNANGYLTSLTDSNGNTIAATVTNGKITKLSDSYGNHITLTYNGSGKITAVTDNFGNRTTYAYDSAGKHLTSVVDSQSRTVSYAYASQTTGASAHTMTRITYADGVKQDFTYDASGSLFKTSIEGMTPVSCVGGKTANDFLFYDVFEGDVFMQRIKLNVDGQMILAEDARGAVTVLEYDSYGRLSKIVDAEGGIATLIYDEFSNLVRATNANGEELAFAYSGDELTELQDAKGYATTFQYDLNGNLVLTQRADGTSSGYTYNANGTVASATNRRGDFYTFTYDPVTGRLVAKKPSNAPKEIKYEYDTRGNLVKITSPTDEVTTMQYDSADRLTKVVSPDGKSIEYTYDSLGRQTSVKSGTDYHVKYTYNSLGLLETVLDAAQGNHVVVRYEYDASGRPVKETQGNGTYTTYAYDSYGYMTDKTDYNAANVVLSRFEYTYDNLGLVRELTTSDGHWTYGYDDVGQLTSATFVATNPDIANANYVYVYDANGNRIEATTNGTTVAYTVNEMNQYTRAGDFTYKYDADGNMTEKKNTVTGETWTFTWCQGNVLQSSTDPNGDVWEYEYDAFGNRMATVFNGVRTEYLVDLSGLGNIIAEYDENGNLVTSYIHGYGLVSQVDTSGAASYYGYDALGSTSIITDASGTVVNKYVYDPFGQSILKTGTIDNPFQFVGEYGVMTGQHSELVSMRARWYDANTGRFVSEDPIGLNGGVNLYAYTTNTPVSYIDPTGEVQWGNVIIAGAGFVGAATQTVLGFGLAATTGWTGVGGVGGVLIGMHGLYGIGSSISNIRDALQDRDPRSTGGFFGDALGDNIGNASEGVRGVGVTLDTVLGVFGPSGAGRIAGYVLTKLGRTVDRPGTAGAIVSFVAFCSSLFNNTPEIEPPDPNENTKDDENGEETTDSVPHTTKTVKWETTRMRPGTLEPVGPFKPNYVEVDTIALDNDGTPSNYSEPITDISYSGNGDGDGYRYRFDASSSIASGDGIAKYEWDFDNDGNYDIVTISPIVEFSYLVPYSGAVVVRATHVAGNSTVGVFTIDAFCPPPASVRARVGENTVIVEWDAVGVADGYCVLKRNVNGGQWIYVGSTTGSASTTYIDTALESGTWEYAVSAFAADLGYSDYQSASRHVEIAQTPPPVVTDFRSPNQTGSSVILSWTESSGATGYVLQYKKSTDSNWSTASAPTGPTATVSNLTANTAYNFRIKAINQSGESDWEYCNVSTKSIAPAAPVSPAGFQGESQAPGAVTLSWTSQPNLSGYKLEYKKSTSSGWTTWTPAPGASATAATVTGLDAGTTYDFRLTAINAGGSASSTTEVTTKSTAVKETASTIVSTHLDVVDVEDGVISFREALRYAGTNGLGTTITFDSSMQGKTITLNGNLLEVNKNISIDGTGRNITIDADKKSAAFQIGYSYYDSELGDFVSVGPTIAFTGLNIVNGQYSAIQNHGTLTMTNCVVAGCGNWGVSNYGTMAVTNCVISGNGGSGITNFGHLSVTNSTISGNSGDGIYGGTASSVVVSTIRIDNTIVAHNDTRDVAIYSGTLAGNNNLIGKGVVWYTFANGVNGNMVGTTAAPIDPKFIDVTNGDYRLAAGSPAINAGSNVFSAGLATDLGGNARIVGGTVDMGAYEYQGGVVGPPTTPTNFTVTKDGMNMNLSWNAVAGADAYYVWRWQNGNWKSVAKNIAGTSCIDTMPELGTGLYGIKAHNATGYSEMETVFTDEKPDRKPEIPENFTSTASGNVVNLSWDPADGADTYQIWRWDIAKDDWVTVAKNIAETSHVDTSPELGTGMYMIKARNETGYSDPATDTTYPTPPKAPTGLVATIVGSTVSLSWSPAAKADTYQVWRWDIAKTDWVTVARNLILTSYVDESPELGSGTYIVKARNAEGYSDLAATSTATEKPKTPTNFVATQVGGVVNLSWSRAAGADTYQVWRWNGSGWKTVEKSIIGTSSVDASPGLGTGLYMIKAHNGNGYSDFANASIVGELAALAVVDSYFDEFDGIFEWELVPGRDDYKA